MIAGSLLLCVFVRAGPSCLVRHYAVTTFNGNWTRTASCFKQKQNVRFSFSRENLFAMHLGPSQWLPLNVVDRCSILLFLNIHRNGRDVACHPVPIRTVFSTFLFIIFNSYSAYISIRHRRTSLTDFESLSAYLIEDRQIFLYNSTLK